MNAQLIEISNSVFGEGYLTLNKLANYQSNENSKILLRKESEEIQGFSIIQSISFEHLQKQVFVDLSHLLNPQKKYGYRKMTAVNPKYKRLGLGIELFKDGQGWFKMQGVEAVLTVSWINSKTLKFRKFLEAQGFRPIEKLTHYWETESISRNYNCASCGAPPCHCNGILYLKKLKV